MAAARGGTKWDMLCSLLAGAVRGSVVLTSELEQKRSEQEAPQDHDIDQ